MKDTLVMIMAGGKGSRLGPLTIHRSKPGVPFAGRYRIIDFVLSNFVNSGYRRIYVLTQYMSSSLIKHLSRNWRLSGFGEYIEVVPAQMRLGEFWYRGTADAVYQNLNLVRDAQAAHVAVFGGDHVYKFDVEQMETAHRDLQSDLTVAAFPVPTAEAGGFGIIDVDANGRIIGFVEKPKHPPEMPGRPGWSLVSMGNYIFRRDVLERVLVDDGGIPSSRHDFGRDIIPRLLAEVSDSVILSGCDIGKGARLRRVLLDKNCKIEPGCVIGEDLEADRARFPFVTESGIIVVPKGTVVPAKGPFVLANDVAELLGNEPELTAQLRPGTFVVSGQSRHSYESAGPRFKKFAGTEPK